jgi:serine protease
VVSPRPPYPLSGSAPCRPRTLTRRRCARAAIALLLPTALACGGGGGEEPAQAASELPQAFRVEGEIGVAYAAAIDGDVNDPAAPYVPNDTFETAQPLNNPVTLGGYANVAGEGAAGRSLGPGDPVDVYRVALAEGQAVRLFIASDDPRDDLDLALIDADGEEVAFSDEGGTSELVVAPGAGEYRVRVSAFAGASNYVLVVAHAPAAIAQSEAPESMPGELVVRFRDAGPDGHARARAHMEALGLSTIAWTPDGTALLACRDADRMERALHAVGIGHLSERSERDATTHAALRRASRRLAKALRRRADVATAEPNYLRQPHAVPDDEFYPLQWSLPMIALPSAWDQIDPSTGTLVAVLDSGVVHSHPDLAGQLESGFDFISDPASSRDGDGCDADAEDPGDVAAAGESSYHGTHVAGIVAARSSLLGGGDAVGVAGAAWSARVMPLRVLGAAGGTDFDLIQAVRYAAGLPNACGELPDRPARVLNLSLGGPTPSEALDEAIAQARAAGLVVVASAGNQASSAPSYPAASPGVISVSAVDAGEALTFYSSFGATIDVAAPGGDLSVDDIRTACSPRCSTTLPTSSSTASTRALRWRRPTSPRWWRSCWARIRLSHPTTSMHCWHPAR